MLQPRDFHKSDDPLIRPLFKIIIQCIRLLALLMMLVIFWSIADVVYHLVEQLFSIERFKIDGLISIFGSFLAVLIAIEIFFNIAYYLRKDTVHVPLVISTALTAAARKIIIFDYGVYSVMYLFGLASVIIAVGTVYWLINRKAD